MKKAIGVVHSLWTCDDCGKSFKHAQHYGHKVSGEVGITGYYDGRGDKTNETKQPA